MLRFIRVSSRPFAVKKQALGQATRGVAGASWSAAVPAAFRSRIGDCKKGNINEQDGQGFEELKT